MQNDVDQRLGFRFVRVALTSMALLGASACNIPLTSDSVYPISVARSGAAYSEEIRTALTGEIILAQPLAHVGFVELQNTVTPKDRVWQGVVTFFPRMEKGLRLYPAYRIGKSKRAIVCSADGVSSHKGGVVAPRDYPICLDLPDGSFITTAQTSKTLVPSGAAYLGGSLWLHDGAAAQTGFIYIDNAGDFAQGVEGPNFTLTAPAQLKPSEATTASAASPIKLGLRFRADAAGARLESIYLIGEQQVRTTTPDTPLLATDTFPRTVVIDGAAIEILAIKDDVLAYRVKRGFPTDRSIISDLPG